MVKGDTPAQDRIDKKVFENLCGIQCTLAEICDAFDVEDDTLNSWCKKTYGTTFSEVFKIKRGKGQISLRRMQWKLAEKNPTMAIWLGKQYLNQKDRQEIVAEVDNKNNYKDLTTEELKKLAGE